MGEHFGRISVGESSGHALNGQCAVIAVTCIKIIFFFTSGQIYMKDAEYAESKKKLIFWFLFFEFWSFLWLHHHNFRWIFTITRKIKIAKTFYLVFILFSKFRNFHKNLTTSEGRGSVCRTLFVLFRPKHDVKLHLRLKNKFYRLLNIKRRMSVLYHIVEFL